MSEDKIFSIREAVLSNLKRLSDEQSVIGELRSYELYDVAVAMAQLTLELLDDGLDINEILSVLSDSLNLGDYSTYGEDTKKVLDYVWNDLRLSHRSDLLVLTDKYLNRCRELGRPLTESDFLPIGGSDETFTYVRNSFSDEAYDVFSQDFSDPKVRYSPTFRDAARAVSADEVTYCLLPLEERGGVRLHTVSELIFRNDFKINSVIPVFGQDGTADIKYALVSKCFTLPEREADDDLYLEVRLGVNPELELAEIFHAIEVFGMSVYRINSVTFDTEGETETYFSVVIKGGETDFSPILAYMTLFVRDFVPVGIYKNLE